MFEQEADSRDRRFISFLVAAVFVTLLALHFVANHLKRRTAEEAPHEPRNILHLEAITHVYECERDGQRVLTDRPCGTGVPIRVIETRSRAEASAGSPK